MALKPPGPDYPRLGRPVAVCVPLPGISDLVWHLPHIRAIAAYAGAPVTLLARPSSQADQLFLHEPSIADIGWLDLAPSQRRGAHDGWGGFRRMVRKFRSYGFGSVVFLHGSPRLAAAAWLAGIPDRRGFGFGLQRRFLTKGPFLAPLQQTPVPALPATQFLSAAGIELSSPEPALVVSRSVVADVMVRIGSSHGQFIAIGVGRGSGMQPWDAGALAQLSRSLLGLGWGTLVLVGSAEDQIIATMVANAMGDTDPRVRFAIGWHLGDLTGLLSRSAFFCGNNTGALSIAAATGTRSYALSGNPSEFLTARRIVPLTGIVETASEPGGLSSVARVLALIEADRGRAGP